MNLTARIVRMGGAAVAAAGLAWMLTGCGTTGGGDAGGGERPPVRVDEGRLQYEDLVSVAFSGSPNAPERFDGRIKADGFISLPLVGSVRAVGLTAGELEKKVHDLYVPKYYLQLSVNVNSENRFFYVLGEVNNKSRQVYANRITVLGAISAAGGFTDFANKRNVQITRANGAIVHVNCVRALKVPALDLEVYPGDRITVKRRYM